MLFLPMDFTTVDGDELSFFSTLATFGTALDLTVAELSIEAFFPADAHTREALQPCPDGRRAGAGPAMSHGLPTPSWLAVRVEWTGYGRSAARALRVAVPDAKSGQPRAPVTVALASNHSGSSHRAPP